MKRPKKPKRDIRQKYTLSDKQLLKIKEEVVSEAVTKTGLLYLAALSEKGWNEDQIVEMFETIQRYTHYIDDHIITLKYVQHIVEQKTGIIIKGGW